MRSNRPEITPERIREINDLIRANPDWHRSRLSRELCEIWGWKGENGQIKDISCRDVLQALDAVGKITLPPKRGNGRLKGGTEIVRIMKHDTTPIIGSLSEWMPLTINVVSAQDELMEFKSIVEQYHYLGYDRNIGENIKYTARDCTGRILACLMFGSAAWACAPRDIYIGWDSATRGVALRYITNNTRFLICPWVNVPHLASHILSRVCRRLSADWIAKYGHPVYLLETFVERDRFQGTCYRAANWRCVGRTTGRGRNSRSVVGRLPVKDVYLFPLVAEFREALGVRER